jgi:hypothetical protein
MRNRSRGLAIEYEAWVGIVVWSSSGLDQLHNTEPAISARFGEQQHLDRAECEDEPHRPIRDEARQVCTLPWPWS